MINLDFFGWTLKPLALYQEDSLISSVLTDETKLLKLESERIDEMSSANRTDRKISEQLESHLLKLRLGKLLNRTLDYANIQIRSYFW